MQQEIEHFLGRLTPDMVDGFGATWGTFLSNVAQVQTIGVIDPSGSAPRPCETGLFVPECAENWLGIWGLLLLSAFCSGDFAFGI
jgi:hypothetical protein